MGAWKDFKYTVPPEPSAKREGGTPAPPPDLAIIQVATLAIILLAAGYFAWLLW